MGWWQNFKNHKVTRQSVGLGIGEGVGDVVGFGLIFGAHRIFPGVTQRFVNFVSRRLVLPHLAGVERVVDYFVNLEGPENAAQRKALSPEQNAEKITELAVDTVGSFVPGWWSKNVARNYVDGYMGITREKTSVTQYLRKNWQIVLADEGVHFGSILLGNSLFKDEMAVLRNMLEKGARKAGFSEEEAKKFAWAVGVWVFPNALGLGAAVTMSAALEWYRGGHHLPARI